MKITREISTQGRYRILQHGMKFGNVKNTCEMFGISRTVYYKWLKRFEKDGLAGLEERRPQKPKMPNQVGPAIEKAILNHVVQYPADGPRQIFYKLDSDGYKVGETGIYRVLTRNQLNHRKERELFSKERALQKASRKGSGGLDYRLRSKANQYPGYIIMETVNCVGKIEGIGKVYQYVIYDVHSKWGRVKLYPSKNAINISEYINMKIVPLMKTFNLPIINIVREDRTEYTSYWGRQAYNKNSYIGRLNAQYWTFPADQKDILRPIDAFIERLQAEFYKDKLESTEAIHFETLETSLETYLRNYNFRQIITEGPNQGKTPTKVVLDYVTSNSIDPESLPLWVYTRMV